MRPLLACAALLMTTNQVAAQDFSPMSCQGIVPNWQLDFYGQTARLNYGKVTDLEAMHSAHPEGADWPIVYTLTGRGDSAIVILDSELCRQNTNEFPMSVLILTQRNETPIVLEGCCWVGE